MIEHLDVVEQPLAGRRLGARTQMVLRQEQHAARETAGQVQLVGGHQGSPDLKVGPIASTDELGPVSSSTDLHFSVGSSGSPTKSSR